MNTVTQKSQTVDLLAEDDILKTPGAVDGREDRERSGRFLSGGIILGSPLSCPDLFLCTITLLTVSRDAPPTLSYTTLEMASRVLLPSKKLARRPESLARFNR
jgi:hypothetical protein